MNILSRAVLLVFTIGLGVSNQVVNAQVAGVAACGPQTPRDISMGDGKNPIVFAPAKTFKEMNLCNIHFHANAEHKGPGFSTAAGSGEARGFKCSGDEIKGLTKDEIKAPAHGECHGFKPGDTIEVHWVYSSCDTAPGEGLESCTLCENHKLRVEAQAFLVVNNSSAMKFGDFAYAGKKNAKGLHQTKDLPAGTGTPVVFLGSTTGPDYTENACSPKQVTWSVRPSCAKIDINSLDEWCKNNPFKKDNHAHGARAIVKTLELLAPISK